MTAVIRALKAGAPQKVALMTSIGASHSPVDVLAAKRHGEEELRASGLEYTIVRPGWFKFSLQGSPGIVLEQGDTVEYDEVLVQHVAQTLIEALFSDAATGKSFEVFSRPGATTALPQAFEALARD